MPTRFAPASLLSCGECLQPVDEGEIRFPVLSVKRGTTLRKVGRIERRLLVDLAGEEAFAERAERHEPDAEFCERRQHLPLRLSPPERVLTLESGHGLDRVGAANRLHARFRKPEVFDFALADQVL
jgi:hypothetical protein